MKELKKATSLQRLDLNGTAITAAGLAELKDLPELATLQLTRTKLSDADLELFKSPNNFKALRNLSVDGAQVTKQGLRVWAKRGQVCPAGGCGDDGWAGEPIMARLSRAHSD